MRLFEHDPELLRWVEPRHAAVAEREVVVDAVSVRRGVWNPDALRSDAAPPPTALVVLSGFVTHSVSMQGRTGTEILGPGDVVCPWSAGDDECLPRSDHWRVLEPLQLAVLDRRFEAVAARLPGVMSEIIRRQGRQARALASHRALLQVPGLPNRVRLTLWCFAERWGRVTREGRLLPLRLTHGTLADLVGAQRPSVTLAIHRLAEEGLVTRHGGGGWILSGGPPTELLKLDGASDPAALLNLG